MRGNMDADSPRGFREAMKVINHSTIQSLGISPQDAYQWVEEMLVQKQHSILPPKISMRQNNHIFYNVMSCILPQEDCVGVKVITRHPEKIQGPSLTSQILLYKASTGDLLAILDGSYITAMRTGAVATHSVRLFANPNFNSVAIIGLGVTATATMDILSEMESAREMTIHLVRYKNQAECFSERYKGRQNLHFVIHDDAASAIRSSEVIISCVTFTDHNFAESDVYRQGCVVIPVHSMGFQNCDICFDKVFADDIDHIRNFKYFDQFKSVAEVASVVRGDAAGRDNSQQRILVYNIGLAIHDIYFANKILSQLPIATDMELDGPNEKMWLSGRTGDDICRR